MYDIKITMTKQAGVKLKKVEFKKAIGYGFLEDGPYGFIQRQDESFFYFNHYETPYFEVRESAAVNPTDGTTVSKLKSV